MNRKERSNSRFWTARFYISVVHWAIIKSLLSLVFHIMYLPLLVPPIANLFLETNIKYGRAYLGRIPWKEKNNAKNFFWCLWQASFQTKVAWRKNSPGTQKIDTVQTVWKSLLFLIFPRVKSLTVCKEEGKQLKRIFLAVVEVLSPSSKHLLLFLLLLSPILFM